MNEIYSKIEFIEQYVDKIENYVKKLDVDEYEIYAEYYEIKSITVQNNDIQSIDSSVDYGISLRLIKDKRIGFSFINKLSESEIENFVKTTYKICRSREVDEYWISLPDKSYSYQEVEGLFSKKFFGYDLPDLFNVIVDCLKDVKNIHGLYIVYSGFGFLWSWKYVKNSHGIYVKQFETLSTGSIELVYSNGISSTPIYYDSAFNRVDLVDYRSLLFKGIEKVKSLINPVRLEIKNIPVVFTAKAFSELLDYTLLSVITAESFVSQRSPFCGKIGQLIFDEKFTLIDNGVLPYGYSSQIFDDEGIPCRKTIVIEKGVLKNVIADNYWGRRFGIESTGNGFRSGYESLPKISTTNIIVESGDVKKDELFSDKFILVDDVQGAHSSNAESGEFSIVASNAWIINKGTLKPIKNLMIYGNIYEILKEIELTKEIEIFLDFISPWIITKEGINLVPG